MKILIFSALIATSITTQANYLIVNKNVSLVSKQYQSNDLTLELPALDPMVIKDSIFSPNAQITEITNKNEKLSLEYLLNKAKNKVVGYRDTNDGSYENYTLLNDNFPLFLQKGSTIKVVNDFTQTKNINFKFDSTTEINSINDSTTIRFSEKYENPVINYLTQGITYRPSYNIYMDGSKTMVNGYFTINNATPNSYEDVEITIVNADINTNFQRARTQRRAYKNIEMSYSLAKAVSVDTAVGFDISKSKDYFVYNYPGKITLNKRSDVKFNFANLYSPNTQKSFKKNLNWYSSGKDMKFDIHNTIPDKIQSEVFPSGLAYVYERQAGKDIFVGTVKTKHTTPGNKFEFSSQKSNLISLNSSSYIRETFKGLFNNKKRHKEEKTLEVNNKSSEYADIILEISMPNDLIKLEVVGASEHERKGNLLAIKFKVNPNAKQKIKLTIIH